MYMAFSFYKCCFASQDSFPYTSRRNTLEMLRMLDMFWYHSVIKDILTKEL